LENLTPLELARAIGRLAQDKKGFDVKILKLKNISSVCDFFVIVSGEAEVHVKAIARAVDEGLTAMGIRPYHREGLEAGNWVLYDYIDVVVHIFQEPTRQFYALEKLWGDAPVEPLTA
jgi:ribosome-associated protein